MEPIRFNLHNFLSYKDEEIDLSTVTCASLIGENGVGKSSILDAFTFILFGQGTKGGSREMDNYVTRGESDCLAEMHFRLNGDIYRIVRGRSVSKNKSTLEFFIQDGEDWRPLSGKSVSDTQEIIERTIRMDYRTFVSSSLILQGKSDSFTANMTDTERKEALGRILGLDMWDQLQEKTREKAKEIKAKLQLIEQKTAPLRETVSKKDQLLIDRHNTNQQIDTLSQTISKTNEEVTELEIKIRQKPLLERNRTDLLTELEKKQTEKRTIATEIQSLKDQIVTVETEIKSKEDLLSKREDIELAVAMEKDTVIELQAMDEKSAQYISASGSIEKARAEVNEWEKSRTERKVEAQKVVEEAKTLVAEWDQSKKDEREKAQKSVDQLRDLSNTWDRTHESSIATAQATLDAFKKQSSTLDQVPCSGTLKDSCPLLVNALEAAKEVEKLKESITELLAETNPHTDVLSEAERVLAAASAETVNPHSEMLKSAEELLEAIDTEINPKQSVLDDAKRKRSDIGYDPSAHVSIREKLVDIRKTSILKADLDAATGRVDELRIRIDEHQKTIANNEQRLTDIEQEIQKITDRGIEIRKQIDDLEPAAATLKTKQDELTALRSQENYLRTELGKIEASLESVAKAEDELAKSETQENDLRDELTVYEILDQACGKKSGVPALIVENAVPEIERIANDMLSRMAGGRLQVRMDTQAEGKSTGTMQEVLRVMVMDGGVVGPYQTYSGAERFMIDLSLRVALSKFLAHRSGAEIKTFVLDEGVGCADASNRVAILNAITAISNEFSKTIVVTHIDELKEAFPQKIMVTKGTEGSKVIVA